MLFVDVDVERGSDEVRVYMLCYHPIFLFPFFFFFPVIPLVNSLSGCSWCMGQLHMRLQQKYLGPVMLD